MKNLILVVDDDNMVLFIHEAVIQDSSLAAESEYFLSAGAALERINGEPDPETSFLIFLDINMPVLNGWQMLDQLIGHPKRDNILVIMVSSSINRGDMERAFSYELVISYLSKPLKEEDLESLKQDERLAGFFSSTS